MGILQILLFILLVPIGAVFGCVRGLIDIVLALIFGFGNRILNPLDKPFLNFVEFLCSLFLGNQDK